MSVTSVNNLEFTIEASKLSDYELNNKNLSLSPGEIITIEENYYDLIINISKFIDYERPYFNRLEQHLDDYENFLLAPEDEYATDYDPRRHHQVQGTMRPGWIRTPYANSRLYRA